MTSIATNASATAALRTLRTISNDMAAVQNRVSSGLRVESASDNSAYWSISTTMRSDNQSLATVHDALGMAASQVEVAQTGLEAVIKIMGDFTEKMIAAREPGTDRAKIQAELEQFKEQITSISNSASFNGTQWLRTSFADIYDSDLNKTQLVSSVSRDASGFVSVKTMDFHLSEVSLFNSTGGGLLEADERDVESIGGLRYRVINPDPDPQTRWSTENRSRGSAGTVFFNFSGPVTFDDPGDTISFNVTVDADDPASGVHPPYNPGQTRLVTIDRSTVDAVDPALNGKITTNEEYAKVLNRALTDAGVAARASASYVRSKPGGGFEHDEVTMSFTTLEDRTLGLDGSYVEVSDLSANIATGGLQNGADFGQRAYQTLNFEPFQVYKDVESEDGISISFNFSVNGQPPTFHSFDRTYVNEMLGRDSGKVETADEMVTLLKSLILPDWPDMIIETAGAGQIRMELDPAVDRLSGRATSVSFSGIDVSMEPTSRMDFLAIDIVEHPDSMDSYLEYLDITTGKIVDGAAALGALRSRIDRQAEFTKQLMATVDKGVGQLVDADMNEESARLKALQTQKELAVQLLQIANSSPESIMSLFR